MALNLSYFSSTQPDALAAAISDTDVMATLTSGATFPDPGVAGKPYTVILGYGSSREEVCTVTAKPTLTSLQLLRGQDGTAATAKNAGDVVVHGVSAREFNDLAAKLDRAGGTMTGPLLLTADATAPLEATPLRQLEAGLNTVRGEMTTALAGRLRRAVTAVAGNTVAAVTADTDRVYVATAALTLTLPNPALVTGLLYTVKSRTAGVVTVTPAVGQIDGVAGSVTLATENQSLDFLSDGTGWVIV